MNWKKLIVVYLILQSIIAVGLWFYAQGLTSAPSRPEDPVEHPTYLEIYRVDWSYEKSDLYLYDDPKDIPEVFFWIFTRDIGTTNGINLEKIIINGEDFSYRVTWSNEETLHKVHWINSMPHTGFDPDTEEYISTMQFRVKIPRVSRLDIEITYEVFTLGLNHIKQTIQETWDASYYEAP